MADGQNRLFHCCCLGLYLTAWGRRGCRHSTTIPSGWTWFPSLFFCSGSRQTFALTTATWRRRRRDDIKRAMVTLLATPTVERDVKRSAWWAFDHWAKEGIPLRVFLPSTRGDVWGGTRQSCHLPPTRPSPTTKHYYPPILPNTAQLQRPQLWLFYSLSGRTCWRARWPILPLALPFPGEPSAIPTSCLPNGQTVAIVTLFLLHLWCLPPSCPATTWYTTACHHRLLGKFPLCYSPATTTYSYRLRRMDGVTCSYFPSHVMTMTVTYIPGDVGRDVTDGRWWQAWWWAEEKAWHFYCTTYLPFCYLPGSAGCRLPDTVFEWRRAGVGWKRGDDGQNCWTALRHIAAFYHRLRRGGIQCIIPFLLSHLPIYKRSLSPVNLGFLPLPPHFLPCPQPQPANNHTTLCLMLYACNLVYAMY